MGFCAEHSAIAAMVTANENKIVAITAVDWHGKVISPCGRCREFIFQINGNSADVDVVLHDRVATLSELLPEHWYLGKSCAA
jgi:cytidine deaminase